MKVLFLIISLLVTSVITSQEAIIDKSDLCSLVAKMSFTDQLYRKGDVLKNWNTDKYSKKEIDSVWKLQTEIDNMNTEKLIELTQKYGWLSNKKLPCESKHYLFLIFRHSQEQYFDRIAGLIDVELDAGRLDFGHYNNMIHHLHGRPHQ